MGINRLFFSLLPFMFLVISSFNATTVHYLLLLSNLGVLPLVLNAQSIAKDHIRAVNLGVTGWLSG